MFGSQGPFHILPLNLRRNKTGLYMILENLIKILEEWICNARKDRGMNGIRRTIKDDTLEDRNRKIVRFIGFALSSTIKKYNEYERNAITHNIKEGKEEENESIYYWIGNFLRKMRVLHKDAIENVHYMLGCYSKTDKIVNHGGLALISLQYYDFAIILNAECDKEFNEDKIHERGNASLEVGKTNIMTNKKIRNIFDSSHILTEDSDIMYEKRKEHINKVYKTLLKKTIHARYSFEMDKVAKSTMGHFAKGSSNGTHRETLKHLSTAKMKANGQSSKVEVKVRKLKESKLGEQKQKP